MCLKVVIGWVVAVMGAGLLLFVWPTLYRYDHLKMGPNSYPVRTHRITGVAELLYWDGWVKLGKTPKADK